MGGRENVRGVEGVMNGVGVAGGLGEAQMETAPASPGHMGPYAVKYFPALFVRVEAVIEERAEEPAALRRTEAYSALHFSVLPDVGNVVAHRRRAQPCERRIFGGVNNLVVSAGPESRRVFDVASIRRKAP